MKKLLSIQNINLSEIYKFIVKLLNKKKKNKEKVAKIN
jgi:hypothetical protein